MKTVQMILRHADFRTTANVYGHLLSSSLDEVGERLSAFLQSRHAKGTSSSLVREHSNDPVKPAPSEGFVVETMGVEPPDRRLRYAAPSSGGLSPPDRSRRGFRDLKS